MATVAEDFFSRRQNFGENPSAELIYYAFDEDDELVARAAILAALPSTYAGLLPQSLDLEPVGRHQDKRVFRGTARYGPLTSSISSSGDPTPSFAFEFGGQSARIQQSLSTVASYAPSGLVAPDFKGAINVTSDGVEGFEIEVPTFSFSLTKYVAIADFTSAYQLTIAGLTKKTNNATFRGFAAKEVRFDGASGRGQGQEMVEIVFRFSVSPRATGLVVGDITGITKDGWDYLWVYYEEAEDNTAKQLVRRPRAVYIEQIYQTGDFSGLGVGS